MILPKGPPDRGISSGALFTDVSWYPSLKHASWRAHWLINQPGSILLEWKSPFIERKCHSLTLF